MTKKTRIVTKEYNEAEKALKRNIPDVKAQYGVPDFEAKLRAAYIHGYSDALLEHEVFEPVYKD
jgi:hypothetical protein